MVRDGAGRSLKGREGGDGEGRRELAGKIGEEGERDGGRVEVKSKGRENGNFERDKGIRRGCKAREGVTPNGEKHNHVVLCTARKECHEVKIGKEKKLFR